MRHTLEMFKNETDGEVYQPGQRIFAVGEPGEFMFVILEGQVELHIGEHLFETLGPGEPFGEMALIDHSPRTATATAKTLCKLMVIPETRFLSLVQQAPAFSLQIMKVMTQRLRRANERADAAAT
jgi:CRP/FNR family cyclic AMP-dependent transcriptional regulator